jgi:putative spermidine/putrescine transport system substrate-binding protein
MTNLKQVAGFAKLPGNVGVGWGVLGIGIVYSPDAFQKAGIKPPTSWNDLANPALKGHVVVDTIASVYGTALLDMLAYANGGSETKIEPGFVAMQKVKPNVMTFDTTADMSPYLEQGGAWAAVWTDAETNAFVGRSNFNAKFVYPKEGSPVDMTTISVVKGAANADLANELANYLIGAQAQYLVATKLGLAPSNTGLKLPKALQTKMPYGPKAMAKLRQMNWKVINAQLPAWTDRWNREIEH